MTSPALPPSSFDDVEARPQAAEAPRDSLRAAALLAWMDAAVENCRQTRDDNRRIREHTLRARADGSRLSAENHSVCAALRERCATARRTADRLLALTPGTVLVQAPADRSPTGEKKPLRAQGPARAPTGGKLRHKNRWLISVDIVAALGRAGVRCDIVVPGLEPARDGCDPAVTRH